MNPTTAEEAPVTAVAPQAARTNILSIHDRCDNCGAQAYFRVFFEKGELDFCKHDYEKLSTALLLKAEAVVDESYKLFETAKLDVSAA